MEYKKSQLIMVWLLGVVVIGGLFFPVLGYLVVGMMAVLLILAFFKGRYWCWNLCPRGAFLDIVVSRISRNKPIPKIFTRLWLRWLIFSLFMGFLIWRVSRTGGDLLLIGAVFVSMCIITTIISIILGVISKHRCWCIICPMGTLQQFIYKKK
ncbi:MAG: 4Fe-4S binding protein [Candidatus Omnitrophota bacterium]